MIISGSEQLLLQTPQGIISTRTACRVLSTKILQLIKNDNNFHSVKADVADVAEIRHVARVAITGTSILVSYIWVKSMHLICITSPLDFLYRRKRAPDPQMCYRDMKVHIIHDDVIKWKHFPRYWPFVRGIHRSLVNSPHKGQWRGALMFSFICAWINPWVNIGKAGDLRRNHAHFYVIVMLQRFPDDMPTVTT